MIQTWEVISKQGITYNLVCGNKFDVAQFFKDWTQNKNRDMFATLESFDDKGTEFILLLSEITSVRRIGGTV